MGECSMFMPLMIIALFLSVIKMGEGQTLPPCGENIFPCLNYINYTIPPKTCCIPLKNMYANQKTCLCQIIFTPGILQVLGVTTSQALKLGQSCGVDVTNNICQDTHSSLAPSSSVDPQATIGGDEGGANRVPITGLLFVMLFWTYLLYN